MQVHKSGAQFSSIVSIGEKIKKLSQQNGQEYLYLNRGVNAVCNIQLADVIELIDFNSVKIQTYPPNQGFLELREEINKDYFHGLSSADNIYVAPGGMACLELIFKTLEINQIYFSKYFWGSYNELATIHNIDKVTYNSLDEIQPNPSKQSAVLICEPNNPIGNWHNDDYILKEVERLSKNMVVIIDSPYRRIFTNNKDDFYKKLLSFKNVIITESFSKCMGLSGQRIGFIHSLDKEFNDELNINILYTSNGVNAFAQELIYKLLSTEQGKKSVHNFRSVTSENILKNMNWLKENNLLWEDLYSSSSPIGIFAVVKKSEEELLSYNIGSVPLSHFCLDDCPNYARVCISIPHKKFLDFFERML
jgi:aspartate aminotransferase